MAIRVFVTGGTIDKLYNEAIGELNFTTTHIREMLEQGRCKQPLLLETLFLKDSLEMTDNDRRLILEKCRQCSESRIVITHGTDTMVETASVLGKASLNKTIVLLGAMIPFVIKGSDSLFNLGYAMAGAQALGSGVYITMNGTIFEWDKVTKNREKGVFQADESS